jgi:acetylglutamate kinase
MEKLTVVKVGGKVVENSNQLALLLEGFSKIEGHKLLVHGGGKLATSVGDKMGIESRYVDGRRITDIETLDVVVMVYAGLVNKNIVARMQHLGINALGLTGADLNLIEAHKRPVKEIDYGFVGDVDKVNGEILADLLCKNVVPVVAPITHDKEGMLLNTNADTIASEVSRAMTPFFDVKLVFCFEKKGVLADEKNDESVIASIDRATFQKLKEEGVVSGGMIPKLDNAFASIEKGVKEVVITRSDLLGGNSGTVIH